MIRSLRRFALEVGLRLRVLRAATEHAVTGNEMTPVGRLYATHIAADGTRTELGLVSTKVVTDAGVVAMSGGFQGTFTLSNFKYHGTGTGTTAEAASQTALVTEVASRAVGSQAAGGTANVYRTIGTVTYAGSFAITEHAIFSASSAGTMLDRSVFAAVNVVSGDSIEFTYDLTLPSGS